MGQAYGYVLLAVYTVCVLTFTTLIYLRRNHIFIRCRNPAYLIVQNLGSLVSAIILSLYIARRPDFGCEGFYVGMTTTFSVFAVPLILRSWEYCVNFHISLLKLHYRSCYYLNWKKTSWVYEHRWIGSTKFLNKALVGLTILLGLSSLVSAFPDVFKYDDAAEACKMGGGIIWFGLAAGLIYVILALGMGLLIYRSQDVYHIKRELNLLALLWTSIMVTFCAYSYPVRAHLKSFPACTFIIIGFFFTLLYCSVVPLIYAWQFDRRTRKAHINLNNFKSLLESVDFRDRFHDFLTKQFCQENLQFYEVVMEWKLLRQNDSEKVTKARAIIDVFITDGSVCQVNVSAETRTKIMRESNFDEIPDTIFDAALDSLTEDMHQNSYRQFASLESLNGTIMGSVSESSSSGDAGDPSSAFATPSV